MPIEPATFAPARLWARRILVTSVVASAALLLLAIALGSFRGPRALLLLTTLGVAAGSLLAYVDLKAVEAYPRLARSALGLLAMSQLFYYALVWTPAIRDGRTWRLWWLSMVASVTCAHLLALRLPGAPRKDGVDRATAVGALLSGAWLAWLGLGSVFPRDVTPLLLAFFVPPALVSTAGSIVLWRRRMRKDGAPVPLPFWARAAWVVGGLVSAFAGGWYVGGAGRPAASVRDLLPSALAGLTPAQVEEQVRADVERVKTVSAGLDELGAKVTAVENAIRDAQKAEKRSYYRPEEDDRIRWAFVTYLSYRAALIRIAATYASFEAVREPELRARCFLTGHAAGCAAFEAGLSFVSMYRDNEPVRRKLNEAESRWGLPAGMFDRIYDSVTDERNLEALHEMASHYAAHRGAWASAGVWPPELLAWLDVRIRRGEDYVRGHALSRSRAWASRLSRRMKEDSYAPVYVAQSALSTWIGDTRITQDPPAITLDQIKIARTEMKPGDIILERRNWFLSNAFLPGFWPHGALYVGTIDDLRRLGIAEHPEVTSRLADFSRPDEHGERPAVIESVSEGVIFNTLSHSIRADHVAILRPRKLGDAEIGEAIVRAFSHQGKPYDFEFDFFTSDKLVCTELVYRAYEGFLRFGLVRVMGRDTLPALEIARKYAVERNTDQAELDFVLMLDAVPGEGRAIRAGPETLIESIGREKSFGR
jgi:hypothetical protein